MPLKFKTLTKAWKILRHKREDELKTIAPALAKPEDIYLKRVAGNESSLTVQFTGFESAVDELQGIPQVKRLLLNWLKKISQDVRVQPSDHNSMIVQMSRDLKLDEAAISVYKRNPKTQKAETVFRCIGGRKSGRKVASPDGCLGVPDWEKKMRLNITKRKQPGHQAVAKKKTQLTNIMAKRIRKKNARIKKARGGL